MSTRKKKSAKAHAKKSSSRRTLDPTTKKWVWGILLVIASIFSIVAWIGQAGVVGRTFYSLVHGLLGIGYFMVPVALLALGGIILEAVRDEVVGAKLWSVVGIFIGGLGLVSIHAHSDAGLLGKALEVPLVALLDVLGGTLVLITIIIVSLIIIFRVRFEDFSWTGKERKEDSPENFEDVSGEEFAEGEEIVAGQVGEKPKKEFKLTGLMRKKKEDASEDEINIEPFVFHGDRFYSPPPLSILQKDSGKPGVGDIKANANIIKRTLANFDIIVEMDEISIGPSFTRYTLKPAEGVRLSKIIGLQTNLELALAAHPVRIEAPIPGKSLVGIEVPNSAKTTVGLSGLFSDPQYRESKHALLMALGKSISGKSHFANLAKAPHLLIAGATNSGKSVTIHVLLNSLLFRNSPQELKLLLVDPKRVELTLYNGIPHLLTPVITDPKKAIMSLKWANKEMERRYEILQEYRVRDISSYQQNVLAKNKNPEADDAPKAMPYIVIIIDELADLMATYPREMESEIIRLAQMSRAVGIHMILSTQRPSKTVITGLIKANIPSRVALQVLSNMESRIVLDTSGAEKLLGAGDMLYLSSEMSKPVRVQSPFISEKEVKAVVKHLKAQYENELPEIVDIEAASREETLFSFDVGRESPQEDDELYEDARMMVIQAGKASTSYLQRRLKVGYSRAARLIDMLEEQGVVGPADGSKPRDILVDAPSPTDKDLM